MNTSNFTIIRGGLLDSADTSRKEFVSAYITNTRLMGVVGMYIHFRLPDNKTLAELHQFFYFDSEEYGFETYESVLGDDRQKVEEIENNLIGGLGGQKVPIDEREAKALLQEYVRFNKENNIPLPEGEKEYGFLLKEAVFLNEAEQYILMRKECTNPQSPYGLINYFLMRIFGKDFTAAQFLTDQTFETELFPELSMGTFLRNIIDEGKEPGNYLCESLVEVNDRYYVTVTSITIKAMVICGCERISLFRVSSAEASMMLSRSEFISVYKLYETTEFTKTATNLTQKSMVTRHDSGDLFMIFHGGNNHVEKKEYRLNADVKGLYFFSHSGQLICTAYSLRDIRRLEIDLKVSHMGKTSLLTGRYEFPEPVIYEFIQSGIEDFHEFVALIQLTTK